MSTTDTCTSKFISIIEVLHVMHKDVMDFKEQLKNDTSYETVQEIMDSIGSYTIDERLPESITTFIAEMVTGKNNYTPENLSSELDILDDGLTNAIKSQEHKESVVFIRNIFKVLQKHADTVTRWLEEDLS